MALCSRHSRDVVFVAGKRHLYAHSAVLHARAPHWRRVLAMQTRFTRDRPTVDADGKLSVCLRVQFQVLRAFLQYLYTDQLRVPPHLYHRLERLAFSFGVTRLAALARQRALTGGYKRDTRRAGQAPAPESTFRRDFAQLLARDAADDADTEAATRRSADISALVAGVPVRAHRFALAARSDYFRHLFESGFAESTAVSGGAGCARRLSRARAHRAKFELTKSAKRRFVACCCICTPAQQTKSSTRTT